MRVVRFFIPPSQTDQSDNTTCRIIIICRQECSHIPIVMYKISSLSSKHFLLTTTATGKETKNKMRCRYLGKGRNTTCIAEIPMKNEFLHNILSRVEWVTDKHALVIHVFESDHLDTCVCISGSQIQLLSMSWSRKTGETSCLTLSSNKGSYSYNIRNLLSFWVTDCKGGERRMNL